MAQSPPGFRLRRSFLPRRIPGTPRSAYGGVSDSEPLSGPRTCRGSNAMARSDDAPIRLNADQLGRAPADMTSVSDRTEGAKQDPPESATASRRMSGAAMVVDYAIREGVRYAARLPGHGSWTISDALLDRRDEIRGIQAIHEQSTVHIADAHYRASGQPIFAFTSIGPGAANTAVGVATAYVDSSALMLVTGSALTDMRGHSALQELDRTHGANFPR